MKNIWVGHMYIYFEMYNICILSILIYICFILTIVLLLGVVLSDILYVNVIYCNYDIKNKHSLHMDEYM